MQEQEKVFINGKSQAISMLKLLTKSERMRIISAIRIKNPSLADELNNQSISFKDIELLNNESLMNLSRKIRPEILGIALKGMSVDFQKRILRVMDRENAQAAYAALTKPLSSTKSDLIQRAQNKVMGIFASNEII
ncbi:MAG: hypothetical protein CME61_00335 [Halobacteriovoraceae bacterium]|nr:hypothetical protein [Halobacteriovoraceae bacterium]